MGRHQYRPPLDGSKPKQVWLHILLKLLEWHFREMWAKSQLIEFSWCHSVKLRKPLGFPVCYTTVTLKLERAWPNRLHFNSEPSKDDVKPTSRSDIRDRRSNVTFNTYSTHIDCNRNLHLTAMLHISVSNSRPILIISYLIRGCYIIPRQDAFLWHP